MEAVYEVQGAMAAGAAHGTMLSEALERLREEHEGLKENLREMRAMAVKAAKEKNMARGKSQLCHLRLWTLNFLNEMEQHAKWEEKELFPFLDRYFNPQMLPNSFESLEQDHVRANQLFGIFMRIRNVGAEVYPEYFQGTIATFLEACCILTDHLAKEEQWVFPLAEQVLTDMDYLFAWYTPEENQAISAIFYQDRIWGYHPLNAIFFDLYIHKLGNQVHRAGRCFIQLFSIHGRPGIW